MSAATSAGTRLAKRSQPSLAIFGTASGQPLARWICMFTSLNHVQRLASGTRSGSSGHSQVRAASAAIVSK